MCDIDTTTGSRNRTIRQVPLIPHAHHDVGYTNSPRIVDGLHARIVDELEVRDDYPYDVALVHAANDNRRPTALFLDVVRQWNATHPELPMRTATVDQVLDLLQAQARQADIPGLLRGESEILTDTLLTPVLIILLLFIVLCGRLPQLAAESALARTAGSAQTDARTTAHATLVGFSALSANVGV